MSTDTPETLQRLRTACLCACLLQTGAAAAVSTAQLDDFSDATLQGWAMGRATITETYMTNLASGGPAGVGDRYLQVVADSTASGGGNRLTFFNKAQWTGDYLAAGVVDIALDVNNFASSETLNLRLAINGGTADPGNPGNFIGGLFATSAALTLAPGSGWVHAVFSLRPADLTAVSGQSGVTGNDVTAALSNVLELRLLNSSTPDWNGLGVDATLGVDNIQAAVPLPPAGWLFGSGLVALLGRARRAPRS